MLPPPRPRIVLIFQALALCALVQCTSTPPPPAPDAQSSDGSSDSPSDSPSDRLDVAADVAVDAVADATGIHDTGDDARADAQPADRQTSDADAAPLPGDAGAGDVAASDGAHGDAVDGSQAITLSTPATDGTMPLPFDIDIGGDITGMSMSVSIKHNVGTLHIGAERFPVMVYQEIPWPGFSYTLYQALAVMPDRWAVIWFYCSGTTLTTIDYEDTGGAPLAMHDALGTCSAKHAPVNSPIQTIASAPTLNSLVQGFQITGSTLSYDGSGPGSMRMAGRSWTVYPFNLIDCSTVCGSPGWYELHSLYWDAAAAQTCFGIFYLQESSPAAVLLEYSICLPQPDKTPPRQNLPSSWTRTR